MELDTDGIWCILPASFPENYQVNSGISDIFIFTILYICNAFHFVCLFPDYYNQSKEEQSNHFLSWCDVEHHGEGECVFFLFHSFFILSFFFLFILFPLSFSLFFFSVSPFLNPLFLTFFCVVFFLFISYVCASLPFLFFLFYYFLSYFVTSLSPDIWT